MVEIWAQVGRLKKNFPQMKFYFRVEDAIKKGYVILTSGGLLSNLTVTGRKAQYKQGKVYLGVSEEEYVKARIKNGKDPQPFVDHDAKNSKDYPMYITIHEIPDPDSYFN